MNSVLTSMLLLVTVFNFSAVSAQTFSFSQNATGPSSVCEGSNVTLQCVIIRTNPDNTTIVETAVWSRNGMAVQLVNSSFIPNHSIVFNSTTGGITDLVITDVRLEDDNPVYSCTATGTTITSSVVLNVTGIPVNNLLVVDRCFNVTASWDITEGSCTGLSYDVTLLSSDGITLQGPNTTIDTVHNFTNVKRFNGNFIVRVVPINGNVRGANVTNISVISVSPNDRPTVGNIRNGSTVCVTDVMILWDAPNSIKCGNVSYKISISPPQFQEIATGDTFFYVSELTDSLQNSTITVTACNRAGQGIGITFPGQLPISLTITVTFSQPVYRVNEGSNVVQLMIVLCVQSSTDISVQVNYIDGSAKGEGVDYDPLMYNVTIPAGQINATVNISINDDNVLEANENFTAILNTSSTFNPVIDREATVNIMDNDNITTMFNQSENRVDEGAANVSIMVCLDKPPPTDFTVEVTSIDGSATGGVDYDPGPYYATFFSGLTIAAVHILIFDDDVRENDETFTLNITTASPFTFVTDGEATFTIVDNDPPDSDPDPVQIIVIIIMVVILLVIMTILLFYLCKIKEKKCKDTGSAEESKLCFVLLTILGVVTFGISILVWYIYVRCEDNDKSEDNDKRKVKCCKILCVSIAVLGVYTLGISLLLWWLYTLMAECCCKEDSTKTESPMALCSPTKVTPTETTSEDKDDMYAEVAKEEPPKVMQKGQLNYAVLDHTRDQQLQRGQKRFGDDYDGHTVEYGQVKETKQ